MNVRKYNDQTKCYKINIYLDGVYVTSTDWSKTCRIAKQRYADINHNGVVPDGLTAFFDRS
mgnify:CR=1